MQPMAAHGSDDLSSALGALDAGDPAVAERLLPLVYDELHAIASSLLRRERPGHTLQPTAVVHEAYLRICGERGPAWQGRGHFLAIAARAMRQVLVDHARGRGAGKRGADLRRVTLDESLTSVGHEAPEVDVLDLHEALGRLNALHPRQAEIVELRFFGGLTVAEAAEHLGVAERTVEKDWTMARAWLFRELKK